MNKIFIDSDVILDLILIRQPFYKYSASLFTLIENKKIQAYTTPVIFSNLNYILTKLKNSKFALNSLKKLRSLIEISLLDLNTIDQALNSNPKDFENALQYFSCYNSQIKFLITRNKRDYPKNGIKILSANEYLKMYKQKRSESDF